MNLATLYFHLLTENTFHTRAQGLRSVDHHQIAPLQIQVPLRSFLAVNLKVNQVFH
jgi:hypothetical protein